MKKANKAKKYETIPVDLQAYARVIALCKSEGMGNRSKGALVAKLIDAAYNEKLAEGKMLPVAEVETQVQA